MAEFNGIQGVLWDMINPIEAYIILRFVAFNVGYNNRKHGRRMALIPYFVIWTAIVIANGYLMPDMPVDMITNAVILAIYGVFYFKGSVLKQVFWYMISVLILVVSDAVSGLVFFCIAGNSKSMGYDYLMSNFEVRIIFSLLAVFIFYISTEIYIRLRAPGNRKYTYKEVEPEMVFIVFMVVLSATVIVYSFMSVEKSIASLVQMSAYILIYIVLLFVIGYYLRNIQEKTSLRRELQLIGESDEKRIKHYEEGEMIYKKVRELRHDEKHHIAYIEMLAQQGDYKEMSAYIDQMHL